jgi:hypothetical protein
LASTVKHRRNTTILKSIINKNETMKFKIFLILFFTFVTFASSQITRIPHRAKITDGVSINNEDNEEALIAIGEESSSQGGIKFDFTYADSKQVRYGLGGVNLGSEIGIPSSGVKGAFMQYLGDTNYPNQQNVFLMGDFLLAGAQKNFGVTIGNFSLAGSEYAGIFTEPFFTNDEGDFIVKLKSINADGDHAHIHAKTVGYENQVTSIGDYGEEALIEINAENTEGDRTRVYVSPHNVEVNKILRLTGPYLTDTYKPGATLTDDISKTGTDATVLSDHRVALSIDSLGYVMAAPQARLVRTATLSLDSATISTANTGGGVEIIPAPPSGYYINVIGGTIDYDFNTTAFDGDQYLRLVYDGNSAGTFDWLHAAGVLTGGSDAFGYYRPNSASTGIIPGASVKLIRSAGSTTGDGSAVVKLFYTIEER